MTSIENFVWRSLGDRVKCDVGVARGSQFLICRYACISNLSLLLGLEPFEKFDWWQWWWVCVCVRAVQKMGDVELLNISSRFVQSSQK